MIDLILKDKLEQLLEIEYLTDKRKSGQAYICSPLRVESFKELRLNMRAAKAYMFYSAVRMDISARAPHAFLPMLLCDTVPSEREMALQFGLKLLEISDEILICGSRISEGMRGEIEHAAFLGKTMRVFEKGILDEVKETVAKARHGDINKVAFDEKNPFMALTGQDVFSSDWDWAIGGWCK